MLNCNLINKMQNRLTVTELFCTPQPTPVGQQYAVHSLFFSDQFVYLIDKAEPDTLRKLSLKNFEPIQLIKLPQTVSNSTITSLIDHKELIVFCLSKQNQLFYFNSKRQLVKLNSHFQPINQIINFKNSIVTCSDDFTLRVWDVQAQNIVHNKVKHVYSGHTAKVTCLQVYQDMLISGSSDQTAIFWHKNQVHCKFQANSPISGLLKCSQSNQFAVFSQNGQIFILDLPKIVKNKKPYINRLIKYQCARDPFFKQNIRNSFEIDDSFILFRNGNQVVFVEINLGQVITTKDICQQSLEQVANLRAIGRILVYGKRKGGLFLLKF